MEEVLAQRTCVRGDIVCNGPQDEHLENSGKEHVVYLKIREREKAAWLYLTQWCLYHSFSFQPSFYTKKQWSKNAYYKQNKTIKFKQTKESIII